VVPAPAARGVAVTGIDRGKGFWIVLDFVVVGPILVVVVGPILVVLVGPILVVVVGPILVVVVGPMLVVVVGPILIVVVGPGWLLVVAVAWSAQAAVASVMVASARTPARTAVRSELRRRSSRFVAKAMPVASDIARSPPDYQQRERSRAVRTGASPAPSALMA
jgi:hypothetical protein